MTSFDDERRLLVQRKVQIEAELEAVNVKIDYCTKKSDELLKALRS